MGPLAGLKVIELAGIGPGPFCGMMLADMGAEVIRVERPINKRPNESDPLLRNRRSIICDLKHPETMEMLLRLVNTSDGIFEGYRPGVAERLGIGPGVCLEANPRIVYGRVTGWGQTGPLASSAGHDLNYIALTGALLSIGSEGGKPVPPLNLIGDYGGGGMLLAFGMVSAMLSAARTGRGQVVDAAMIDGVNIMMAIFHQLKSLGWHDDSGPGKSFLSGAAHFYNTYETADGKFISIAPIEPQFYELLLDKLQLDRSTFAKGFFAPESEGNSPAQWGQLKQELEAIFKIRTRSEWCELLEGTDVCFAPVLSMSEARDHAHSKARNAFVKVGDALQPAPAPRFSVTKPKRPEPGAEIGADTAAILAEIGYSAAEIGQLIASGAVRCEACD